MALKKYNVENLVKVSFTIIYTYFGVLKFFPNLSPAESLAAETIDLLTFNSIPAAINIKVLALWEVVIAGCFIFRFKWAIRLALCHLIFTFSPLFLLYDQCFSSFMVPTLAGQYILKNLILVSVLLLLWEQLKIRKKILSNKSVS